MDGTASADYDEGRVRRSADCGDVHNRGSDGTLGVGER
ncbi:hypothetical protein W91_1543 [Bifidobacterium animalis subsp. lactis Bi-07]|nr:hypothetical protein W91_1543 [Bifidobacterium animalis subsp. lactis Bi-07]